MLRRRLGDLSVPWHGLADLGQRVRIRGAPGASRRPGRPGPVAVNGGSDVDVEPALVDPAHHAAQLFADTLDEMLLALALQRVEHGAVGHVLQDPLARELATLDLGEQLAHGLAHVLVDDARAAREVAVLGGVADAVAHPGDALLPHEVDDELELVEALEVGDLRLVAGLDERVEAGRDELHGAAAEHGLLAEEVGLGLFGERGLEAAGAQAADAGGVGQSLSLSVAARVLVHGDEHRHAFALFVLAAHDVTGTLGGDHGHVHRLRRHDLAEVDVEAVREHAAWRRP